MQIEISAFGWVNLITVFLLGVIYSFVELINAFRTARTFFTSFWGLFYIFLNGLISVIALVVTFQNEINQAFIGSKILLAGTSALALMRVVSIPVKHGDAKSNAVPMIEIILNFVKTAYDRNKSKNDLELIQPLMANIDYYKFTQEIPKLCGNMLNTLSEEDGKKMTEEIQKFLSIETGNKELKSVNLGFIMVKYVGYDLLKVAIDNTKEHLCIDENSKQNNGSDIDSLIDKFK